MELSEDNKFEMLDRGEILDENAGIEFEKLKEESKKKN